MTLIDIIHMVGLHFIGLDGQRDGSAFACTLSLVPSAIEKAKE